VLTLSQGLDDGGEGQKSQEQDVEFFEAGEDAAKAFQSAEQSLDLIALALHGLVILPGFETIALGWNHRYKAEIQRQLPSFVVLVTAC
jgi:hypothetical protein